MNVSTCEMPASAPTAPRRHHVAHAWVTKEIYDELVAAANRRGVHPDQLAAALITVVVGERLVNPILDR